MNKWQIICPLIGIAIAGLIVALLHASSDVRPCHVRTSYHLVSCYAELKVIDGSKAQWALDHHKRTNDVPNVVGTGRPTNYLRDIPVCPRGGTYTLGRVGEKPRCSIPEHTI